MICVTPDNLSSPWLHFETGALSKAVGESAACPYLFRVPKEAVKPPLSGLQLVEFTEEGTRKLVETISRAIGGQIKDPQLKRGFEKFWPDIKAGLDKIQVVPAPPARKVEDLLVEILELTREIERRIPRPAFRSVFAPALTFSPSMKEVLEEYQANQDRLARLADVIAGSTRAQELFTALGKWGSSSTQPPAVAERAPESSENQKLDEKSDEKKGEKPKG